MTDRPPYSSPPPDRDWRDTRREERRERSRYRDEVQWWPGGSWVVGLILIALGAIFLAQNFGYPIPRNWWALFILLPAFACLGGAWSMYQRHGRRMTPPVTSALVTGLILVALATIFLLDVELGKFWPVILIVMGVAALLGGGRWRQSRPPAP
jgi:peptidoglycan/LPS O-acetylase OafA/YrhL